MKMGTKITKSAVQRKVLQTGFALGLFAITPVSVAFAQTSLLQQDKNTPIVATPVPLSSEGQDLPNNLQPEQLAGPAGQIIHPKTVRRVRPVSRNRWDPSALTQTTGLNAASFTGVSAKPLQPSSIPAVATGLLSTEALLDMNEAQVSHISLSPSGEGMINLSASMRGALFDLPTDNNINASVFKLDLAERLCLGTADECRANELQKIDVGYAANITHGKIEGLNLQLTPHAGVRFNDDSKSALVGALVRIGDNLREGSEMKSNTWYFFAGADAEAVTYTPNSARRLTSGEFHLQNRIIVGDAQAGVGYRIGTADLSLTYFKRQAKAENYSYDEDAAALSITWKR